MKKIKLIIFHPYSHVGGADNSLKRLIEQLDTRFFSITFVSLNESFLKKDLKKSKDFLSKAISLPIMINDNNLEKKLSIALKNFFI